ncbi:MULTISPECIES: Gfo/Idh/MocA family oxidoreductase [Clostridium]|uniref:Gfo/Idh/MocA family oxidoreductase n=1 Tax=Clostridium frigoriphilum TaxID=443253 RepID=A0ABU7UK40_9CLOT|nr:Gfo/Idh/MocA family oxidoreductase [Clostridium sp. DSM 17811]MBU3099861.1 Gfo/Idh/MocA family oxidoreductase [Clostridium sp. DSM 17811]
MNKIINVGLVGYGMAGKVFHAPIITTTSGLNLYKVYTTNEVAIKSLKESYSNVLISSNINELLNDPNIELVVIAVPNSLHYELAKKALENNKHVVVEKPFTVTTDEADKLIDLAKQNGKILTVHQNRRWDSDFKTVEKIVKSNLLGDVVEYEAHYDRFRDYFEENTWKEKKLPGTGILYNLGSHLIDQALFLFGLPTEVFGDLRIQRHDGIIIDNFEIILNYQNLKVTLKAGTLVKEISAHFTLLGTKGSFIKYGMDVQEESLKEGLSPNDLDNWGKEPESMNGKINTIIDGLHITGKIESEVGDYGAFYTNVYNSILGKDTLKVTASEARDTIKIIELAKKSSLKKQWVTYEG